MSGASGPAWAVELHWPALLRNTKRSLARLVLPRRAPPLLVDAFLHQGYLAVVGTAAFWLSCCL